MQRKLLARSSMTAMRNLPRFLARPPIVDPGFPITLVCLLGKRFLADFVFSIASFSHVCGRSGRILVLSDGSLTTEDITMLEGWHQACSVFGSLDAFAKHCGATLPTALGEFASNSLWGQKLAAIWLSQQRYETLVLDSDVVFFRDPFARDSALSNCRREGVSACLFDCWECSDPDVIEAAARRGINASTQVNDGLVYLPRQVLRTVDWEVILPVDVVRNPKKFTNMSALAVALQETRFRFLPDTFLVSPEGGGFPGDEYRPFCDTTRPYFEMVCRHFVTPARHLMWLKAFPLLEDSLLGAPPLPS